MTARQHFQLIFSHCLGIKKNVFPAKIFSDWKLSQTSRTSILKVFHHHFKIAFQLCLCEVFWNHKVVKCCLPPTSDIKFSFFFFLNTFWCDFKLTFSIDKFFDHFPSELYCKFDGNFPFSYFKLCERFSPRIQFMSAVCIQNQFSCWYKFSIEKV